MTGVRGAVTAVAINFSDNDFSRTFRPVAAMLHDLRDVSDKEVICEIINNLSYGSYLLHQHRAGETKVDPAYLRITPGRLLVGKEVEDWLECTGRHNSSCWFIYHGHPYDKNVYVA